MLSKTFLSALLLAPGVLSAVLPNANVSRFFKIFDAKDNENPQLTKPGWH
jgi:hypothetical protein